MDRDNQLVEWFKDLFAKRTPPNSILDAHPDYRVTWHETAARMKELGYGSDAVGNRITFAKLFVARRLMAWCNRKIRETGSTVLMSAESKCSRTIRKSY